MVHNYIIMVRGSIQNTRSVQGGCYYYYYYTKAGLPAD